MGCILSSKCLCDDPKARRVSIHEDAWHNVCDGNSAQTPAVKERRRALQHQLDPRELLRIAGEVLLPHEDDADLSAVDECMLAAVAVLRSHGDARAEEEWLGEQRVGLCLISVATARWLAAQHGYCRFGDPSRRKLLLPDVNLYYAAAYLQLLAGWEGRSQEDHFIMHAFTFGPKTPPDAASARQWQAYQDMLPLLGRVWAAMQEAGQEEGAVTMHIAGPGEDLDCIARCAGVTRERVLAANPELDCLQPGDCIALPCAAVVPRLHIFVDGDTLEGVAATYASTLGRLLKHNPQVDNMDDVGAGTLLMVPGLRANSLQGQQGGPMLKHTLRSGENLRTVAARFAITLEQLLAANAELKDPLRARRGMTFSIPN